RRVPPHPGGPRPRAPRSRLRARGPARARVARGAREGLGRLGAGARAIRPRDGDLRGAPRLTAPPRAGHDGAMPLDVPPGTPAYERNAPDAHLVTSSLAGSRPAPFWLEDLPSRPARPALHGERSCELLVVGGGYTGLWTAVQAKLREPGRRVVLLEARRVGWAASGRNGGFCEASITHGEANGRSRWPEEYDTLHELGLQNLRELEADVERLGIDAQLSRSGSLTVAVEPYQVAELEGSEGFLDTAAVRARIDSPLFLAGVHDAEETALVHPARLAEGLAAAASELGVEIFEDSPARSLEASRDELVVRTDGGSVRAARVVLATNAFPALLRRFRLHTVPVFDYVLMTEP